MCTAVVHVCLQCIQHDRVCTCVLCSLPNSMYSIIVSPARPTSSGHLGITGVTLTLLPVLLLCSQMLANLSIMMNIALLLTWRGPYENWNLKSAWRLTSLLLSIPIIRPFPVFRIPIALDILHRNSIAVLEIIVGVIVRSFKPNHALVSIADREIPRPYHQRLSSETIFIFFTTLLLSMSLRSVDPVVVGVALRIVYRSPFNSVACCKTSLFCALFLSEISFH